MNKIVGLFFCSIFFLSISCNRKKYTEVVEVPLPSKEDKLIIGLPEDVKAIEGAFSIVKIPYKYEELAPNFDALTMEIHYSKQYLNYTNNLNKLVKGTEKEALTIEEILKKLDVSNTELKNNAGGYYNHSLYFDIIGGKSGGKPKDSLAIKINKDFGSFDIFKNQFTDAALKQFGSGWAWLIVDKSGKLQITSTPNQDNPLMPNQSVSGTPILALDVWEHAYFLTYQNKRKNYIDAFFKVINWGKVNEKFDDVSQKEFLKGAKIRQSIIREKPELADWWIDQEQKLSDIAGKPVQFDNKTPSYETMKSIALTQSSIFDNMYDNETISCFCGD